MAAQKPRIQAGQEGNAAKRELSGKMEDWPVSLGRMRPPDPS